MSYMDRENILTESQIDDILRLLRKDSRERVADKVARSSKLQRKFLNLQKKVDDVNKGSKELERLFGTKHKDKTILDFI